MAEEDALRIEVLRTRLGIRSTSEIVRYALKVATDDARPEPAVSTADAMKALELWQPTDFEGTRAKAVVESTLRRSVT